MNQKKADRRKITSIYGPSNLSGLQHAELRHITVLLRRDVGPVPRRESRLITVASPEKSGMFACCALRRSHSIETLAKKEDRPRFTCDEANAVSCNRVPTSTSGGLSGEQMICSPDVYDYTAGG